MQADLHQGLFAIQLLLEPVQGLPDRLSSSEFNFRHIQELTCSAAACGKALCPLVQWTGRLPVPQLPFGFEPMLLVTARLLSLREPNLVGLFRDRCRGWGCALQL